MLVQRWQAPIHPSPQQIRKLFEMEGLEASEEILQPSQKILDHRHPFGEVRIILSGEMIFNVAGNQVLLRPGDRIEVPANTRHAHAAQGQSECLSLVASRIV